MAATFHGVRIVVVLVPVLCAELLLVGCARHDPKDDLREMIARELQSESGDIEVRGLLRSETGGPLQGVRIDVEVRDFGDVTAGIPPDREMFVADGEFVIKKQGMSSISLVITKDGYYAETWSYNFSSQTPRRFPEGVEIIEVEVVLREKPSPAPLRKIEDFVRATAQGPVDLVTTAPKRPAAVPLRGEELRAWKARSSAGPSFSLEGWVGADGEFVIDGYTPREQNHTVDGLSRGWIRISGGRAGDGFVRFAPEYSGARPVLGLREMSRAPYDGYTDSLELGVTRGEAVVYFFCRVGGLYGKGMVSGQPYVVDGDEGRVAAAKITVFLNPTGSPNVAYVHH